MTPGTYFLKQFFSAIIFYLAISAVETQTQEAKSTMTP
jgi:hypothetical protein